MKTVDMEIDTSSETEPKITWRPRPSETVSVSLPIDVIASLTDIAGGRDMSLHGLLRLYIGQGLRVDLERQFSERIWKTTASVLARHIASEEERQTILREIREQAA